MEQQVLENVVNNGGLKGALTLENGVKLFAAIGAATVVVATYKAVRNELAKRKADKAATAEAKDSKGNKIKVDIIEPEVAQDESEVA